MSQYSQKIIIIGGGQAAGWAAKTLREQGHVGPLIIISDEPYDFYQRPLLLKNVFVDESDSLPHLFSDRVMADLQIKWRRPLKATAINAKLQMVTLNNGEILTYDQLVIATGGQAKIPEDWQNDRQILSLHSWDDAIKVKRYLKNCQRLAIIGGGWLGLEMAAIARQADIEVTLFESQPQLCHRNVNQTVSDVLLQLHQQQGVTVWNNCGPISLKYVDEQLLLTCKKTRKQPFDLMLVGMGLDLNLQLARAANINLAQGICVDEQGRTNQPNIFAIGDVACHPKLGICLQSQAYTQNQAITTAKAMLGQAVEHSAFVPYFHSNQYQTQIQILGTAVEGQVYQRVTEQSQLYFTLDNENQLRQLVAFNDAKAIKVAQRWMQSGRQLDPQKLTDASYSLSAIR